MKKACQDRLRKRLKNETDSEKAYEVYVPIQQEMSIRHDGKRKKVDRIVFPALVFIRCTDSVRRKEIVCLPYIKRFMVNIAGSSLKYLPSRSYYSRSSDVQLDAYGQ